MAYRHIFGAALLADGGFAMGMFVTALAFDAPAWVPSTRLSIPAGTSLSTTTGVMFLACSMQDQ